MNKSQVSTRMEELQKQIAELKSSWPAHSVPPAMLQQLEELEDELELLLFSRINPKQDQTHSD